MLGNYHRKTLLLLFVLGIIIHLQGQTSTATLTSIKRSFYQINSDTHLAKVIIGGEDFLDEQPDGGAELTGFFKNKSLVKIAEWIGISSGNRTKEYYFQNNHLIFVYAKFESFVITASGDLDKTKTKVSFEARYYFDKGRIILKKSHGNNTFDPPAADLASDLNKDAEKYADLLVKKLR
jgi:hypothetical protein